MIIRTLEGDVTIRAQDDIYIMIGISGEAYPISKDKFIDRYTAKEEPLCGA